jgi:hypothetical protein
MGIPNDAKRIQDSVEVAHLRPTHIQLADVATGALELPVVRLPVILCRRALEGAVDDPRDQIGGQSAPRRGIVVSLPLEAGSLQKLFVPGGATKVIASLPEHPLGRKLAQA